MWLRKCFSKILEGCACFSAAGCTLAQLAARTHRITHTHTHTERERDARAHTHTHTHRRMHTRLQQHTYTVTHLNTPLMGSVPSEINATSTLHVPYAPLSPGVQCWSRSCSRVDTFCERNKRTLSVFTTYNGTRQHCMGAGCAGAHVGPHGKRECAFISLGTGRDRGPLGPG